MILESQARAKINLYLKVMGRRLDGYHELDSLMARLDLADQLVLEIGPGSGADSLAAENFLEQALPEDFGGPGNLVLKAVAAYRRAAGWPEGAVTARLEKRIPLGAGLGGGSADCAAALRLLNNASPRPLDEPALFELALKLGADVPFCLFPGSMAKVGGIGEKLAPAPAAFAGWRGRRLTLVNPGLALPTARVFEKLGLTKGASNNNLGPKKVPAPGENDLLKPALALAPELGRVVEFIDALRPSAWGLSGSGATFWLYEPGAAAQPPEAGWRLWDVLVI